MTKMPKNYIPNNNDLVAYLEFIQKIIERMATNSRQVKIWSISLTSALLTFGLKVDFSFAKIIILIAPANFAMYVLDGFYLGIERGYRDLYSKVTHNLQTLSLVEVVNWNLKPIHKKTSLIGGMRSPATWIYYVIPWATIALLWCFRK